MPSTKSQSPGPSQAPPTSLPAQPKQKAPPKKKKTTVETTLARPGSAGGVRIDGEKEQKPVLQKKVATDSKPSKLSKEKSSPTVQQIANQDSEGNTKTSNPGNRERRRPRKLNRETTNQASNNTNDESAPLPGNTTTKPDSAAVDDKPTTEATTAELEALKSRVRGLEAKVEELYKSGASGRRTSDARSPRRRGKRKGSSATQVPTVSTTPKAGQIEELEDDDDDDIVYDELVRLEGELAVARRDLEAYGPRDRPRAKRSPASADTEYVEEIPRGEPGVVDTVNTGDRQVTLSGSYRIPLPASVSMEDVKNIQSGVSAAQSVARSFLEQRRAARSKNVQESASTGASGKPKGKASARQKQASGATSAVARTEESAESGGKQSWGEWFGGYSLAISRAVKNIEAEAAIESQRAGARASGARAKPGQRSTKGAQGRGGSDVRGQQPLYD